MSRFRRILAESNLKWYEHLWIGWPLVLVVAGGLWGGACSGAAWALNRKVFRKIQEPVMRYLLTGMISVSALVLYSILAAGLLTVVGTATGDHARDVTGKGESGFEVIPLPDGVPSGGIVIFAPANCPSDAAQRADALAKYLSERKISYKRASAAEFSDLDSREEAERAMAVMNGPIPVV